MRQKKSLKFKFGEMLRSKLVIFILIFIVVFLVNVLAGDIIVKEGAMDVSKDLNVSGNIITTGNLTAAYLYGDGSGITGIVISPLTTDLDFSGYKIFASDGENDRIWLSGGSGGDYNLIINEPCTSRQNRISSGGMTVHDGSENYYFDLADSGFTHQNDIEAGAYGGSGVFQCQGNYGINDQYDEGTDTQISFTGGIATSISTAFDEKLMTNIVYLGNNPTITLTPISFYWNEDGLKQFANQTKNSGKVTGYYKAQDVQKFYPDCIVEVKLKEFVIVKNNTKQVETGETAITYNRNCVSGMLSQENNELKSKVTKICANQPDLCK